MNGIPFIFLSHLNALIRWEKSEPVPSRPYTVTRIQIPWFWLFKKKNIICNIYKIYYLKINRVPRYCTEETMGFRGGQDTMHTEAWATIAVLHQAAILHNSPQCLLYTHLRSWVFNLSISAAVTVRGVRKNTQCSPCVHGFKEIAKGQERPRSPSWGRAQPRERWTELPCPSGATGIYWSASPLFNFLLLRLGWWSWCKDDQTLWKGFSLFVFRETASYP